MKYKILVTGANGLLGSALRNYLGTEHIYHTRADCDLLNYTDTLKYFKEQVETHGVNTIIHAAARVGGVKANMENNSLFFKENYYISNNVLKAAFELNIDNFVNVLSTCIFPDSNIAYPLTPEQIDLGRPHESNHGYSYAKRLSGYETKIFREITKKNWYSVVPTNLYGPNDNFNLDNSHLIPGMIHRAYLAKQLNTPFIIWGDGKPLRQFLHSDDLARLIFWTLENWNKADHCMIVNPAEVSVMEIAEIIKNKFNLDDVQFDTTKPAGQFRKPAITDITKFPWLPLNEGIENTIDWFINNYNTLRK